MVTHLRDGSSRMLTLALTRNLMARRLCVIQQKARHFVRYVSEMRDSAQEIQKSFAKKLVF